MSTLDFVLFKISAYKFKKKDKHSSIFFYIILGGNSLPHPFGLDLFGDHIYWTDWKTQSIERANKFNGQNRTVLSSNMNDLMDVRVFHRNRKYFKHACNSNNGGCSHLCLLKPRGHSCGCPTGITLGVS